MKTITFTYTKENGEVSSRVLLVSNEPTKNVSGTDITSMEEDAREEYLEAVKELKDEYLKALKELNEAFDLSHSYRQFKPSGMTNIVEL